MFSLPMRRAFAPRSFRRLYKALALKILCPNFTTPYAPMTSCPAGPLSQFASTTAAAGFAAPFMRTATYLSAGAFAPDTSTADPLREDLAASHEAPSTRV